MRIRTIALALLVMAAPAFAAQHDEAALKKDLTAVIALQGKPCGEVTSVTVLKQNDYNASCKDGNKYHVYENDKGRVIVDKQ